MTGAKRRSRKDIKGELAMGRSQFVFRRGVIGWGIPALLLYLLISSIVQILLDQAEINLYFSVLFGVLVFSIAGIFIGRFRWQQLLEEAGARGIGPARKNKKGEKK